MSVWLTPELKPFYGGTYFPPQDGMGRPGFPRVLLSVAGAYKEKRAELENAANSLAGGYWRSMIRKSTARSSRAT